MDQVKKGTTTVGLICDGGVVLASEKRATMGSFIASKAAKKIYQVDDYLGVTTAGIVGDAQTLIRMTSVEMKLYKIRRGEPMTVKGMATLLSNVLNGQRFYPYIVQLLLGGMDRNGAHIFSIDPFGGNTEEKEVASTGSGSPIAYGVLEDRYTKGMSLEDGTELAIKALYSAIRRDSASGGEMEVVVITKDKYETLSEERVQEIRNSLN
ncbi:proteasome endopeptidase complex, archaeal, beta subunit [ANME-1 cluster archaeon GoMg4]|nr:proteasome endopeptidase complex, archaeal, beta subunit [ANME-1 cluster archaeon GoMg4]